jgi:hypothetical protein
VSKATPGELLDPPDLPLVIVGACGCVLRADSVPVGVRFVLTSTGDKRVLVYCCPEHTRLNAVVESDLPPPLTKKPKPKRAAKSSPSKGTKPRPSPSAEPPKPAD